MAQSAVGPFQSSRGNVVVESFVRPEEDDLYIWIHRSEDESDKDGLYEAVYEPVTWTNEISPKIPDMMDREKIVVRRIEPMLRSAHH